jgi:hypothetical protein
MVSTRTDADYIAPGINTYTDLISRAARKSTWTEMELLSKLIVACPSCPSVNLVEDALVPLTSCFLLQLSVGQVYPPQG